MLNFFKKMFGKPAPPPRVTQQPRAVAAARPAEGAAAGMIPKVEVVHLSLAAIIGKMPDDMRRNVAAMPDQSATVALPLATIQKQLPSGSVKMSLASLYRQAPAGTFAQTRVEDKRMVEIPLSEVFRHVRPDVLPRRADQRRVQLPTDAVQLFGDKENPYALAPAAPEVEETYETEPLTFAEPAEDTYDGIEAGAYQEADANGAEAHAGETPAFRLETPEAPAQQRVIAPPAGMSLASSAAPEAPARPAPRPKAASTPAKPRLSVKTAPAAEEGAPLVLPLASLCNDWPEPIRAEAQALGDTQVALPASLIVSALARGRVVFTWEQIRSWLNPASSAGTEASEATELTLPLKIVAPAFLKSNERAKPRKSLQIDESIPALFSGGERPAEPAAPEPEALPAPESLKAPEPSPAAEPEEAAPEPSEEPAAAPEALAAPISLTPPVEFAPPAEAPEPEPVVEPAPEAEAPAPAEEPTALEPATQENPPAPGQPATKRTVGELFNQPDRTHWSPQDLVRSTATLPGVRGAVMGLHEGLVVAAELPEGIKAETVAAFLPQMFARVSNYSSEMQLGQVHDLLFTADGALFQAYRLGEVYFAALGKPGEPLPWDALRTLSDHLAQQTAH